MFYVYVLECSDGSLYTGYTDNIEKRLNAHNSGKASRYTRSRLPVRVVYSKAFQSKSEAMKTEAKIKRMPRKEKLAMLGS